MIDFASKNPRPDYSVAKSCAMCHGREPRPLNSSYPDWPGFEVFAMYKVSSFVGPDRPEIEALAKLYPSAISAAGNGGKVGAKHLNTVANHFAFRAMLSRMRKSPQFKRYRFALAAGLMNCADLPSYLGNEAKKIEKNLGKSFNEIRKQTALTLLETKKRNRKESKKRGGNNGPGEEPRISSTIGIAGARYLFEGEGIDFKKYSTDYEPGRKTYGYSFWDGGTGPEGMVCLMERDLGLALKDINCETLKARSLEALKEPKSNNSSEKGRNSRNRSQQKSKKSQPAVHEESYR